MSQEGLALAVERMRDRGVGPDAVKVFEHYYRQLEEGQRIHAVASKPDGPVQVRPRDPARGAGLAQDVPGRDIGA